MKLKQELASLFLYSDTLLDKEVVSVHEFHQYKTRSELIFAQIIIQNYNETLNYLAKEALKFKIKRIENPLYRKLYYYFVLSRNAMTFDAPYLKGLSTSDIHKQYIFWIKMKLDGIIVNLNKL